MATNVVMSNGASNKWVGEEYSPLLAAQISVLVEKEEAFYTGVDYLAALAPSGDSIDEGWRQRAAEWMFRVVDFYDLDRDIVNVGMAYLDRMFAVSSLHLQWGEQRCNIITVASLKLAIKLMEPRALNLDDMVKLATKMGGGFYTPRAIIEMEQEMLWKFSWDVFPPTAYCFAHHMICLLPNDVPRAPTKYLLQELAKYQSELAVCVYQFVKFKPSSVSLACCLVAIDNLDDDCLVSPEALTVFLDRVFDLFGLRHDGAEILFLMNELKELLCHNTDLKEFVALIRASNKPNDSEPSPKTAAVKTLSH